MSKGLSLNHIRICLNSMSTLFLRDRQKQNHLGRRQCHWTLYPETGFYSTFQIFLTGASHLISLGETICMLIKLEDARAMIIKTTMLIIIKSKRLIEMSQRCPVYGKSTNIRLLGKVEGAEVGSRHLERSPELRVPKKAGQL